MTKKHRWRSKVQDKRGHLRPAINLIRRSLKGSRYDLNQRSHCKFLDQVPIPSFLNDYISTNVASPWISRFLHIRLEFISGFTRINEENITCHQSCMISDTFDSENLESTIKFPQAMIHLANRLDGAYVRMIIDRYCTLWKAAIDKVCSTANSLKDLKESDSEFLNLRIVSLLLLKAC